MKGWQSFNDHWVLQWSKGYQKNDNEQVQSINYVTNYILAKGYNGWNMVKYIIKLPW
jgi:hypothetical protein